MIDFVVHTRDVNGVARLGTLTTAHGAIETPAFMPVGSLGAVKGIESEDLQSLGYGLILNNAYHLYLRPGHEVVAEMGGLHRFTSWPGAILTDSGGFQVFSLGHLRKLSEEGAAFKSHLDGSPHLLTPESVMRIEAELGADIILPLDICAAYPCSYLEAKEAMERTHRWAERALIAKEDYRPEQALFGIVHGAFDAELRRESAHFVGSLPFPGLSIGGLSVGEPKQLMWEMLHEVTPALPREKPRHLLGVGSPEDFVVGVGLGMDMFDCVLPTRVARHGGLFTPDGRFNIKSARFRTERGPVEEGCDCYTCQNYSAAYVHHLARTEEQLYFRLGTIHNIRFMLRLAGQLRETIIAGTYAAFRDDFIARYKPAPEKIREEQRVKWKVARTRIV